VFLKILIYLAFASGIVICLESERRLQQEQFSLEHLSDQAEVLYLPSGEALDVLSFGYKNIVSNIVWFSTINYFGKHYRGDKDYRWLYHRCSIVLALDRKAIPIYEFCSTMLAWEQNSPVQSIKILDSAIENFPRYWKFYYLRGFTYMFFLKDNVRATEDLIKAAKLPGVHPVIASLAAKKLTEQEFNQKDSKERAREVLKSVLSTTSDPLVQEAIEKRLEKLK
jgi:hypothetical protein